MAAFVVAVTGGIASGKSAVCALFALAGVSVADADAIAHAIVAPGEPALAEIVARFGAGLLHADGSLDRGSLRALVFAEPDARAALETITHPRIRAELERRCRAAPGDYAIADIPLLAEAVAHPHGISAAWPWLQRILVVDAPVPVQRARLLARDGIDTALAERMIAAQATRGARLALATDVIVNDGALALLAPAVQRLDARFRQLAARG
ncbi:MAG: dephospho-CoA kinase [Arenimonas sp.]